MTRVQITHPAPDQNGTSVQVGGVEMRERIQSGGLSIQFRKDNLPPLVTLTLLGREVNLDLDAEVTVDDATSLLLEAAGWTRAEVSA